MEWGEEGVAVPTDGHRSDRDGDEVRQLNTRVPAHLVAEMKKRAIDFDITLADAVTEAISEWLDAHPADGRRRRG